MRARVLAETMPGHKFGKLGIFCCNFCRLLFFLLSSILVAHKTNAGNLPAPNTDLRFLRVVSGMNIAAALPHSTRGEVSHLLRSSRRSVAAPRRHVHKHVHTAAPFDIIQIKKKIAQISSFASAASLSSSSFSSRSFASLLTRSQCSCSALSCLSSASNSFTSFFSSSASCCCSLNFSASLMAS